MKIDSLIPPPSDGVRARVGVDVRIMFLLTSILSLRGEKRYCWSYSLSLFLPFAKGRNYPSLERGARGDF